MAGAVLDARAAGRAPASAPVTRPMSGAARRIRESRVAVHPRRAEVAPTVMVARAVPVMAAMVPGPVELYCRARSRASQPERCAGGARRGGTFLAGIYQWVQAPARPILSGVVRYRIGRSQQNIIGRSGGVAEPSRAPSMIRVRSIMGSVVAPSGPHSRRGERRVIRRRGRRRERRCASTLRRQQLSGR